MLLTLVRLPLPFSRSSLDTPDYFEQVGVGAVYTCETALLNIVVADIVRAVLQSSL